jgi:hypothetical protein
MRDEEPAALGLAPYPLATRHAACQIVPQSSSEYSGADLPTIQERQLAGSAQRAGEWGLWGPYLSTLSQYEGRNKLCACSPLSFVTWGLGDVLLSHKKLREARNSSSPVPRMGTT